MAGEKVLSTFRGADFKQLSATLNNGEPAVYPPLLDSPCFASSPYFIIIYHLLLIKIRDAQNNPSTPH